MMIIGFCNLKGGVGKTTSCQNIAAALKKEGKKVAVVDMDPQSNLSAGFGVRVSQTDPQVFDLLSGAAEWDDVIKRKEGIDIVPSSLNLVMAELNNDGPIKKVTALRDALAKIKADRYDYILLDSPPQLGIFTQNVLAACNKIIVPMDGGFYSLYGLRLLDSCMKTFHDKINPELEICGILMTNYNPRLYLSRQIHDEVRKSFGNLLFESYIRQNITIDEASSMGMSVIEYDPKSKGSECYREVAREFMKRFEGGNVSPAPAAAPVVEVPEPEPAEIPHEPEPEPEPEPETVHEEAITESPDDSISEQTTDTNPGDIPTLPDDVEEPPLTHTQTNEEPKPITPKSPYVQGIIDDVLDMLPDAEKAMWAQLFNPIDDVSRGEIEVHSLREDFEDSDKDRYTFYVLNDESPTFWPVMYPDQIIEPLKCVMKWDENGAVEVYM